MRYLVLHDLLDIFSAILRDKLTAARVVVEEARDIVDLCANRHVAGIASVLGCDICLGQSWKCAARHRGCAGIGEVESAGERRA